MLEKMLLLREKMGLRKPACYQGDYNLNSRGMDGNEAAASPTPAQHYLQCL